MSIQSIKGFTLIELVIVMVIVSILATMTTDIMIKPVKSYIDLERRSTLVNSAEIAIRRIQRDIRRDCAVLYKAWLLLRPCDLHRSCISKLL